MGAPTRSNERPLVRSPRIATLGVAVTTVAVTVATASPALAQRRSIADSRQDVWVINDDHSYTLSKGSRFNVDLVRSSVTHSAKRVKAQVRYADLVRNTDTTTVSVRI